MWDGLGSIYVREILQCGFVLLVNGFWKERKGGLVNPLELAGRHFLSP